MNAEPVLNRIASAMNEVKLEAVMIGNAAAAIQGAPLTTLDIDFMIREIPGNIDKLKTLAAKLDAELIDAASPMTTLRSVENADDGIYLDFVTTADGIRCFESLRSRSVKVVFDGNPLLIADLRDIIASKRAARRAKDRAVMELLEQTLDEKKRQEKE
jgi:hypothetical protein